MKATKAARVWGRWRSWLAFQRMSWPFSFDTCRGHGRASSCCQHLWQQCFSTAWILNFIGIWCICWAEGEIPGIGRRQAMMPWSATLWRHLILFSTFSYHWNRESKYLWRAKWLFLVSVIPPPPFVSPAVLKHTHTHTASHKGLFWSFVNAKVAVAETYVSDSILPLQRLQCRCLFQGQLVLLGYEVMSVLEGFQQISSGGECPRKQPGYNKAEWHLAPLGPSLFVTFPPAKVFQLSFACAWFNPSHCLWKLWKGNILRYPTKRKEKRDVDVVYNKEQKDWGRTRKPACLQCSAKVLW